MPRTELQSGIAQQVHDVLGFKLTAVCFDQGGYNKPSRWKVVITCPTGAVDSDYTMGSAHRRWKPRSECSGLMRSIWASQHQSKQDVGYQSKKLPDNSWQVLEFNAFTEPNKPDLLDVMSNLLRDAQCGQLSFEDFCSEMDYDSDRISHKEIWEACCKTQRQVARAKWPMETLQELFQDY